MLSKMLRAHKIRLYPTREQEVQMLKTAGTSRYVYNWGLATWQQMWKEYETGKSTQKPSVYVLSALWTKTRPLWTHETARSVQDRALKNLGDAFQALWRGNAKVPKFHKRGHGKDSFYINNQAGRIEGQYFYMHKIGYVALAENLRFKGKIMGYIVSFYAGQWQVSICVEIEKDTRICNNMQSAVGVDVGLKHVATASDGTVLDIPEKLRRLDVKLRKAQRALDRAKTNSHNRQKRLRSKQKVQNRINNIRHDITHKFTSTITKNHGVVVVEDLDLQNMVKEAKGRAMRSSLARSLMGMVLFQLSYKAKVFKKADKFYPSTKLCSSCGHKRDSVDLKERTYVCPRCGAVLDRDLNAAINLCKAGAVSPSVPVE